MGSDGNLSGTNSLGDKKEIQFQGMAKCQNNYKLLELFYKWHFDSREKENPLKIYFRTRYLGSTLSTTCIDISNDFAIKPYS